MRWVALLALIGCSVPLDKSIVSWPLTGSLDSKTGPLAQVPGTFLALDNVRQERLHEWKRRQGIVRLTDDDDVSGAFPPLMSAELPGGGIIALTKRDTNTTAALQYSPTVPTTAARWTRPATSQTTPGAWKRRAVAAERYPIYLVSSAVGNGFRLVAWKPGNATVGQDAIRAVLMSDAEGASTTVGIASFGSASGTAPKCVYEASQNRFFLFWVDGTDLKVAVWNGATGAIVTAATTLTSDVVAAGQYMDARYYSNNKITVVYRMTGDNAKQLEINPSTLAVDVNVDLGVVADSHLALFPDPDASGVRFVALSNTTVGEVRVLRTTTAAAISSNDQADTISSTNIIGCAYQAGAGWQIVYRNPTLNTLKVVKKYSGAVGAALTITPNYGGFYTNNINVDSNAWREPDTDAMHFIVGNHSEAAGATGDLQHNFYEYALPFETGSSTVSHLYTEPQARLIPLNAGYGPAGFNSATQVTRTGSNKFALALTRLSQPGLVAGLFKNQYAVDVWDVEYATTSWRTARPNIGRGAKGSQASYLPAGQLLQSVNGQLVVGHGGAALPFQPTGVISAGAGLTSGQEYRYKVSIDYPDENGRMWKSPLSRASNAITPSGGNLQITVTICLPDFDHWFRYRTVRLWRTLGNGSVYQLVYQTTVLSDPTNSILTVVDAVTDVNLALSEFPPVGLPATITPAFNHVEMFDGRMFGAERDFPTKLRFTKLIGANSPEFPAEFEVQGLEDEYGDITAIRSLDDKLVVFKQSAVYVVLSGGPNDDGSGGQYRATRINADVGSDPGTPTISIGDSVWFFSGGVHRISKSTAIDFIGAAIDKYFNQPLVETPEYPVSFTFNDDAMEVRLLTTSYRFVYSLIHGTWTRDTGGPSGALDLIRVTGIGDMFVRSDGQIWWDYDTPATTYINDESGAFTAKVRSPWVRVANVEGAMRLYSVRSIWLRTPVSGSALFPTTRIYRDNVDSLVEAGTPFGTTADGVKRLEYRPRVQRCSAFSLEYQFPPDDVQWRIDQWAVLVGIKTRTGFARGGVSVAGVSATTPDETDLRLWLSADQLITLSSTEVTDWGDRTANNYDYGDVAFHDNPTFATNQANGQPLVIWTGNWDPGDALFRNNFIGPAIIASPKAYNIFAAIRPPAGYSGGIWGHTLGAGTGPAGGTTYFAGTSSIWIYNDGTATPPRVTWTNAVAFNGTSMYILEWRVTGGDPITAMQFLVNGVLQSTTIVGSIPAPYGDGGSILGAIATLGGPTGSGLPGIEGGLGEFMIYDSAGTAARTSRNNSYLANKWGISV